jgi:very-short-patch-repair endonuclease
MNAETLKILEGYAARMRGEPTNAECRFRHRLAGYAKEHGFTFVCQQVCNKWIFDFYIVDIGVFIEVDGPIHTFDAKRRRSDKAKQADAERRGFVVLRVKNENVSKFNFDKIPTSKKRGRKTQKRLAKLLAPSKRRRSQKVQQDQIIPVGQRKIKVIKRALAA